MARIRHIAIGTDDPEATAKFYMEGLGLQQVGRVDSPTAEGYYLSDGHVNMAILKWRQEWASVTEGAPKRTGVHHIGFGVEDMDSAQAQVLSAGAVEHVEPKIREEYNQRRPEATGGGNVEVKFTGPDGVTFDLSVHGWAGTDQVAG
ncbi:MAG: VOC family protein [Chloroflexi bacterium]|nr:VOC family protein [Chloroflexota bacterium]